VLVICLISVLLIVLWYNETGIQPIDNEVPPLVAPVVLKMSGFAEKVKNNENWFSRPFFAFWKGYQICLRVYAGGNGDGKGTHLSAYIFLMKGPHDDELAESGLWPLRGTFTIELLNQLGDYDHHSVTVTFYDDDHIGRVVNGERAATGWGIPKAISLEDILHRGKYLKNNLLYYRISYRA